MQTKNNYMRKLTIAKAAINLAAESHVKEILGEAVNSRTEAAKTAKKAIKADFTSGVEWAMKQTSIDRDAYHGHELIANERMEQIIRGYDAAHDDRESKGQLAEAAGLYALEDTSLSMEGSELPWPWPQSSYPDKRGKIDRVRQLTIAGSLIAAELDRLIRKATPKSESEVTNEA